MINKKGFVLAETLVVTIFVLLIFSVLYENIVPLLGRYNELSYYDDLDTTYDVYQYKKLLEDDTNYSNISSSNYKVLTCDDFDNVVKCDELNNVLNISGNDTLLYLNTNYKSSVTGVSDEIKDYLNYINLSDKRILLLEHNDYISYVELGTASAAKVITVTYNANISINSQKGESNFSTLPEEFTKFKIESGKTTVNVVIPSFGNATNQAKVCRKSGTVSSIDASGKSITMQEEYHGYQLLGLSDKANDKTPKYCFGDTISNVSNNITLYAIWKDVYATGDCETRIAIRKSPNGDMFSSSSYIDSSKTVTFKSSRYVCNASGDSEHRAWYPVEYNGWDGYTTNGKNCRELLANSGYHGNCQVTNKPRQDSCNYTYSCPLH